MPLPRPRHERNPRAGCHRGPGIARRVGQRMGGAALRCRRAFLGGGLRGALALYDAMLERLAHEPTWGPGPGSEARVEINRAVTLRQCSALRAAEAAAKRAVAFSRRDAHAPSRSADGPGFSLVTRGSSRRRRADRAQGCGSFIAGRRKAPGDGHVELHSAQPSCSCPSPRSPKSPRTRSGPP